jgi:hypothetical protein
MEIRMFNPVDSGADHHSCPHFGISQPAIDRVERAGQGRDGSRLAPSFGIRRLPDW